MVVIQSSHVGKQTKMITLCETTSISEKEPKKTQLTLVLLTQWNMMSKSLLSGNREVEL